MNVVHAGDVLVQSSVDADAHATSTGFSIALGFNIGTSKATAHVKPDIDTFIGANVNIVSSDDILVISLHNYDTGFGFRTAVMASTTADNYEAVIDPQDEGTTVYYYVEAEDEDGETTVSPEGAPDDDTYDYTVVESGYEPPPLFVNEFLAKNDTVVTDPDFGNFGDWIELYNASEDGVDLGGMFLTDDLKYEDKWEFPAGTIIEAGGFLLIWADNLGSAPCPPGGCEALHTDFKLSASNGDDIGLFDTEANGYAPIDSLTFAPQEADKSYGRTPDGANDWQSFDDPTPEASNG